MENRLKKILASLLDLKDEIIDEKISAETIDGWDSLKQMNIIVAIEEEFDILFDEEESILANSYVALLEQIRLKTSDAANS